MGKQDVVRLEFEMGFGRISYIAQGPRLWWRRSLFQKDILYCKRPQVMMGPFTVSEGYPILHKDPGYDGAVHCFRRISYIAKGPRLWWRRSLFRKDILYCTRPQVMMAPFTVSEGYPILQKAPGYDGAVHCFGRISYIAQGPRLWWRRSLFRKDILYCTRPQVMMGPFTVSEGYPILHKDPGYDGAVHCFGRISYIAQDPRLWWGRSLFRKDILYCTRPQVMMAPFTVSEGYSVLHKAPGYDGAVHCFGRISYIAQGPRLWWGRSLFRKDILYCTRPQVMMGPFTVSEGYPILHKAPGYDGAIHCFRRISGIAQGPRLWWGRSLFRKDILYCTRPQVMMAPFTVLLTETHCTFSCKIPPATIVMVVGKLGNLQWHNDVDRIFSNLRHTFKPVDKWPIPSEKCLGFNLWIMAWTCNNGLPVFQTQKVIGTHALNHKS